MHNLLESWDPGSTSSWRGWPTKISDVKDFSCRLSEALGVLALRFSPVLVGGPRPSPPFDSHNLALEPVISIRNDKRTKIIKEKGGGRANKDKGHVDPRRHQADFKRCRPTPVSLSPPFPALLMCFIPAEGDFKNVTRLKIMKQSIFFNFRLKVSKRGCARTDSCPFYDLPASRRRRPWPE